MMIHMHNTPMQFWANAINIACYTVNRIFLRPGTKKTSYELQTRRKPNLKYFQDFGSECYILRDEENLGKFDAKSDIGTFLGYSISNKAYRIYNQNSQIIQESSNVVINDTRYDQDIIDIQILTQESIWDNPENVKNIEKNPNNIPERDIDPNKDEIVPLEDTFKETRNKHRSRVPKNHPISNVMSNVNKHVVTKR